MSNPNSIPDGDRLHPPNGSQVKVFVVEWRLQQDNPFVIFEDVHGLRYNSWIDDDNRWQTRWRNHLGQLNIGALIRVGKQDGPFGMKSWPVDVWNEDENGQQTLPEVTRSPLDVFKAPNNKAESLKSKSRNITFEGKQAEWLDAMQEKMGEKHVNTIGRRCVAMAMAWHGAFDE